MSIVSEEQAFELSKAVSIPLFLNMDGSVSASSFANYCAIMSKDAYLRDRFRLNLLDGRPEVTGAYWSAERHPIRDADLEHVRRFIDLRYGINNEKNIRQAVNIAAFDRAYHPIRDTLNSLAWDGEHRLSEFLPRYLGAERSDYTTAVTRVLFSGAIQRVQNPGIKFDYCVILADTRQGTGKSTICQALALDDAWYTDSIGDLGDSKKAFEAIRGKWIVELGELMAVRKTKDIEAIKAFITRQADVYRNPYGVYAEDYARQCVFIGTTNRPQFLPEDKTGNRRFLPVLCDGSRQEVHPMADFEATREYVRQCYAEMMALGINDLTLDRKHETYLDSLREQATPEDSRVGMVQEWLNNCSRDYVCTRLIWDKVFAGTQERPPQGYELRDIADILNLQIDGWTLFERDGQARKKKFEAPYGTQRAWIRVAKQVADPVADGLPTGFKSDDDDEKIPF